MYWKTNFGMFWKKLMGRKSLNQIIQNLSLSLTIDLSKDGMKANFYYETVEFYLCHSLKRGDKDDNSSWVFFEAQKLQFIKCCSVRKKATPATVVAVAVTLNIIWKSSSSVTRKNRQMSIKVAQKWFNWKNGRFWNLYKRCLRMWESWAN